MIYSPSYAEHSLKLFSAHTSHVLRFFEAKSPAKQVEKEIARNKRFERITGKLSLTTKRTADKTSRRSTMNRQSPRLRWISFSQICYYDSHLFVSLLSLVNFNILRRLRILFIAISLLSRPPSTSLIISIFPFPVQAERILKSRMKTTSCIYPKPDSRSRVLLSFLPSSSPSLGRVEAHSAFILTSRDNSLRF